MKLNSFFKRYTLQEKLYMGKKSSMPGSTCLVLQKMSEENQEMVEPKDTSQISRSSSTFQ